MTVPVVLAIAGVFSLLVGVLGGGIKAKEIEIPSMPTAARLLSSIGGLALIGIAIWLSSPGTIPVPPPTESPEAAPPATETAEPSPTATAAEEAGTEEPPPPAATDTPAPPTPEPSPAPFAGPFFGNLVHNPDNGDTEGQYFGVSLRNFILEGTVFNPFPHQEHLWSFGIGFRYIDRSSYIVVISSDGAWYYGYYDEEVDWHGTAGGRLANLAIDEGESNQVRLVAYESAGCLYVNGALVAELDLSGLEQPGNIYLSTGPVTDTEVSGEVTRYENFVIYRTSSLDCP
jgi:hypothetical protein